MGKINLSGLVFDSVVDGPGLRTTIFTQGCPHKCKNCHNPSTWNFNDNKVYDIDCLIKEIDIKNFTKKITISGGEPLAQLDATLELVAKLKELGYHIVMYTGYTYEYIKNDNKMMEIIKSIDILIDGIFDENLRDPNLLYRGSSNQNYIDFTSEKD